MMMDDNDGQMIFGDLGGLKLPDICLTGEEKPQKNLTQETCPDRGSNPGPLRERRACYHLAHSGGRMELQYALSGHVMYGDPLSIYLAGNCSSKSVRTMLAKCGGAPSCW